MYWQDSKVVVTRERFLKKVNALIRGRSINHYFSIAVVLNLPPFFYERTLAVRHVSSMIWQLWQTGNVQTRDGTSLEFSA